MKVSSKELKKLIVKEIKNIIDEEALLDPESISSSGTGKANFYNTAISNNHNNSHHHKSSYMAKPQLSKIAEYAQKLYDMIHENEQLDDWMESHIAQMADDISEVYHALSYDKKQHK